MKTFHSVCIMAALACLSASPAAYAANIQADIVISGGSMGAPAAALAAARTHPQARILLIEPTDWLGGQATSQGVSAIDNAWHQPAQKLMIEDRAFYYPKDYSSFLNQMKNPPADAPGKGLSPEGTSWVSREAYDPRTGAWVLDRMVAEHPNIHVLKMTVVKDVKTSAVTDSLGHGQVITGLSLIERAPKGDYQPFSEFLSKELPDWFSPAESDRFTKTTHTVKPVDDARGLVVVDASETADAIVLSGADYVVGREITTETVSANGTPPAHHESASQATVFPFCMTDAPTTHSETALKEPWPDFDDYYKERKTSYFGLGKWSWERVWTYRRLLTTGAPFKFDDVFKGDVTMQNWYPGNDYPDKSLYLTKALASAQKGDWQGGLDLEAVAGAEKIAIAFYFYMKEFKPLDWDIQYLKGDHPLNMMGTGHGLAKFPYIRCGRRILGLENFRLLQSYLRPAGTEGDKNVTSHRFYDSVAIGNYALDSHAVGKSTGVAHTVAEQVAPFYLPYRALASSNVRNLLAGCKNFAGTYWTNSAYRLHPIEWSVGSAAGTAAGLMARDSHTNADLLRLPHLRELQSEIAKNSPIHWKDYDSEPIPESDGDLIVNHLKPVTGAANIPVQIYSFGSSQASILINGKEAGETTTKVNDHLVYVLPESPGVPFTIEAICRDKDGATVATLKAEIKQ